MSHLTQKRQISAKCSNCGIENQVSLYAQSSLDIWVPATPAYAKDLHRYLCVTCAKKFKPSAILALEKRVTKDIRLIPIYNKSGNLLPSTIKQQIEALPHFYPLRYLAEKSVIATYMKLIKIANCKVLQLFPFLEQDSMMDIHTQKYGFIYTTVSLTYPILLPVDPFPIKFTSYYDDKDRLRVKILYMESHVLSVNGN